VFHDLLLSQLAPEEERIVHIEKRVFAPAQEHMRYDQTNEAVYNTCLEAKTTK
jgi:hypothetical protein